MKAALEDISKIPEDSIVMFHACAHNPTGTAIFISIVLKCALFLSLLCSTSNLMIIV